MFSQTVTENRQNTTLAPGSGTFKVNVGRVGMTADMEQ